MTYGDMISAALKALPSRRGTLEDIYSVIEEEFSAQLNTELEAGPRQAGRHQSAASTATRPAFPD